MAGVAPIALAVLGRLSDQRRVSGAELARELRISRAAVWQVIEQLRSLGIGIEARRGLGYRLEQAIELLDASTIRAGLSQFRGLNLEVVGEVDSTNAYAARLAARNVPSPALVVAELQTAGRGRRGRSWVSPFARNVYLSLLWRSEAGAAVFSGLSLAMGVAVARALGNAGLSTVRLKWPNDLLIEGKKLGGILVEVAGEALGRCHAIIGIGLNLGMPDSVAIDQPWADVANQGFRLSRNQLVAEVAKEALTALDEFSRSGLTTFLAPWSQLDAYAGKRIRLITPGGAIEEGISRGIRADGSLMLEGASGITGHVSGELSLRPAETQCSGTS